MSAVVNLIRALRVASPSALLRRVAPVVLLLLLVPAVYAKLAALESGLARRLVARAGRLAAVAKRVRPASVE